MRSFLRNKRRVIRMQNEHAKFNEVKDVKKNNAFDSDVCFVV